MATEAVINNAGKHFRRQAIPAWVVSDSEPRLIPAVLLAAEINSILFATLENLNNLKAWVMCFLP